jgi:hypothetical protein
MNNGTHLINAIESNNKKQLLKDIKEIAFANRCGSEIAHYFVADSTTDKRIYRGIINEKGKVSVIAFK